MASYTAHLPPTEGDAIAAGDRVVLVADRFSWGAFVFGPLWFLAHRLWLVTLGWFVVVGLLGWLTLSLAPAALGGVMLVVATLVGLEASSLRRWTLERRRWRTLDVVVARNRTEAERAFFGRAMAAAATRPPGAARVLPPVPGAVTGLFPQAREP